MGVLMFLDALMISLMRGTPCVMSDTEVKVCLVHSVVTTCFHVQGKHVANSRNRLEWVLLEQGSENLWSRGPKLLFLVYRIYLLEYPVEIVNNLFSKIAL